ncbi:thioredoxin domain-containing protein [Desulfovibrio psychrotolerans]|uniref:Thioredoxin domain-containing protein n=1 Tax=Desulfovibrio psychrotolerans TaxID=415242 RepID=A0A7J0BQJ0_9BACT|nr:thioredoxin domain-containing protein [Desulfovibrio psychrotolerans]GFM35983.1 thioredoxin domain-containing protein [Desulfovibrio psychrotolerans]
MNDISSVAPNALAREKSPYLLQHAHNPVDWHPWGEDAFALARRRDRPVFLSIGYSTCHWCHVMAHESFEDAEVAALMNEAFVNIKVDREERPDIDAVYMNACHMLTGRGGWPLTIIMTPDRAPFFAGTYLPRASRQGRMGMLDLVPRVRDLWMNSRDDVLASAASILGHMRSGAGHAGSGASGSDASGSRAARPDASAVRQAAEALAGRFDTANGGFGEAPKFPSPHNLLLLLRRAWTLRREKGTEAGAPLLAMVSKTLEAMRMGGLYDHVGYGFHRYSTDARWLLPHFEKMLYDQAMLAWAYTEGWQATGNDLFRRTAEEVFAYVLRDMTDGGGGFRSAEDADSLTDRGEHEEGWFYTFTLEEVRAGLPDDLAELAVRVFGLRDGGNFAEEATGRATGRNIVHRTRSVADWAATLGCTAEELAVRLEAVRAHLYALREKRARPHVDDKVLTDWNGLMIGALARGARAFDAPQYAEAASRAALFVLGRLRTEEGGLLHRYRDGEAGIAGMLDDYAFFIHGLIELYQATHEPRWLAEALRLQERQEAVFADREGGYYLAAADADPLPVRSMEAVDGALPSGNSMSLLNLLRLARLLGRPDMDERADMLAQAFAQQVRHMPSAFAMFLCGVDGMEGGGRAVVVTGQPDTPRTEAMLRAVDAPFAPDLTLHFRNADDPEALAQVVPFTRYLEPVDGVATAYLCENYACSRPVTDVAALAERLR